MSQGYYQEDWLSVPVGWPAASKNQARSSSHVFEDHFPSLCGRGRFCTNQRRPSRLECQVLTTKCDVEEENRDQFRLKTEVKAGPRDTPRVGGSAYRGPVICERQYK